MIMKLLSSNVRYLFSSRASTMHLRIIIVPTFKQPPPLRGGAPSHPSVMPALLFWGQRPDSIRPILQALSQAEIRRMKKSGNYEKRDRLNAYYNRELDGWYNGRGQTKWGGRCEHKNSDGCNIFVTSIHSEKSFHFYSKYVKNAPLLQ